MIEKLALVGLGGALGAIARYAAVTGTTRLIGPAFPYGTLGVNVLGSFLMGLAVVALVERLAQGSGASRLAPFLMAGVLGGFTTFSAFSLDTIQLIERERWLAVLGYVSGSVVLSIAALGMGVALGRALWA